MGFTICMNDSCGVSSSPEWKKGWPLRSGGFANLCFKCGTAYEKSRFCETFHLDDTGWRDCKFCGKRIHCGCAASLSLYEILDYGGVGCASCANGSQIRQAKKDEVPKIFGGSSDTGDSQSSIVQKRMANVDEGRLLQLCKIMEANEPVPPRIQGAEINESLRQSRQDEINHQMGEVGREFASATPSSIGSLTFSKTDVNRTVLEDRHDSFAQPSLNMTLGTPLGTSNFVLPFSGGAADGSGHSKTPSLPFDPHRARPIFPKPVKHGLPVVSETNSAVTTHMRLARPPGEGRGKNQLLPRYWPRITDQELEKLSGDLNSTVVPLFEKVLSASDAGRIGRLVLPKACAEAYFPPISQSEGLPLRIQDVRGNEWTFQFRFWPNNNSRMYVLEGVTPCIQSMQLQAGDTVTFSRINPGGKLVIGFRKASNTEAQTSGVPNGTHGETSFSGVTEKLPVFLQTTKGIKNYHLTAMSENLHLDDEDNQLHKGESSGCKTNEDIPQQPVPNLERKRARNIGSKSKRLLMHSEDALELRLTWEEAQDLLRPPPTVKPSIVTIEDQVFEEYNEPPVFGKRTTFVSRSSGARQQWTQCDDCSKWRRVPVQVLLPPKWTCSDNVWDSCRESCSAPEELSSKELESLLRTSRDLKKRRITGSQAQEYEPSGLDALASAAVLGDNVGESSDPTLGATTKHPRHRPGCSCIVCIQPPSGKGKHKPTCTCNVCMTVKRRFKTLMLRKKKRQAERESESGQKENNQRKDKPETNGSSSQVPSLPVHDLEKEGNQSGTAQAEVIESTAGQIDLNADPNREDMQIDVPGLSMTGLVQAASGPSNNYMRQTGISSLMYDFEQLARLDSRLVKKSNGEGGRDLSDERCIPSVAWERENRDDGGLYEPKLD
ncbi:hypothetical protein UlMin_012967 [Ulmus minor]